MIELIVGALLGLSLAFIIYKAIKMEKRKPKKPSKPSRGGGGNNITDGEQKDDINGNRLKES